MALLFDRLKLGGRLHLATDWEHYALQMMSVMEEHGGYRNLAGAGEFSARPEYRPMTKFEKRGIKLGHQVFDLIFEKTDARA